MKKFYRIFILVLILVILSTFNPKEINLITNKNKFFQIKNIKVENTFLINAQEIKEKLSNLYYKNIFFLKEEDIEGPLKQIHFFDKVEVKKKYPDTIVINIFETEPIGIIFKNKEKYILDSSSKLILLEKYSNLEDLPGIFGDGAEDNFIDFLNLLKINNFPNKKIKNFYYFKIGRWDLQLLNDKTIKLPHKNIDKAISKSIEILQREDFQKYNIIDLRVEGKIIVE